jgi:hypothetical protein
MSTPERNEALESIFEESSGIARTAPDASAIADEALGRIADALKRAQDLGDADLAQEHRYEVDRAVRDAAIEGGRECLGAMRGLAIGDQVDAVSPRLDDGGFGPLDDGWMKAGSSYGSALQLVEAQQERVKALRQQSNQLFRRLAESVAFAADLAGWTAWVDLPEAN